MTVLADLMGRNATAAGEEAGYWRPVKRWCLGENLTFGTCGLAGVGNLHVVVTTANGSPEVMSDGEIERMYHDVGDFVPTDKNTDHGVALEKVLEHWAKKGWAGDPTLVPDGWCAIAPTDIHQAVHSLAGAYSWCVLPAAEDGQWDFSDAALQRGVAGTGPHCIQIVGSDPLGFTAISWARRCRLSHRWWEAYGRGQYAVKHPAWKVP